MRSRTFWSAYQTERGYSNGTWMMFPAFGGGNAEFDFKIVEGVAKHVVRNPAKPFNIR